MLPYLKGHRRGFSTRNSAMDLFLFLLSTQAQRTNETVECLVNFTHPVQTFVAIFSKLKCWVIQASDGS